MVSFFLLDVTMCDGWRDSLMGEIKSNAVCIDHFDSEPILMMGSENQVLYWPTSLRPDYTELQEASRLPAANSILCGDFVYTVCLRAWKYHNYHLVQLIAVWGALTSVNWTAAVQVCDIDTDTRVATFLLSQSGTGVSLSPLLRPLPFPFLSCPSSW